MNKRKNIKKIIISVLSFLYLLTLVLTIYNLISLNLIPAKYTIIITCLFVIIYILFLFLVSFKSKKSKFCGYFIILISTVVLFWISLQAKGFMSFLDNQLDDKNKELYVVVLKSSSYKSINDIRNIPIYAPAKTDIGHIKLLNNELQKKYDFIPKYHDVPNYEDAADKLISKTAEVVLIDSSLMEKIEQKHSNFKSDTRIIYTFKLDSGNNITHSIEDISAEPFNIYISGDDQFGDLGTIGRSDVNIIATVNPKTKQILLTSVPRDTYVKLAIDDPNAYDKLTHATTLGVNTTIKTLENLLNIDISYFVRINFSSLIKIVDAIDGIEVNNPEPFNTYDISELPYNFEKGNIQLNGSQALAYSRERYYFGDERVRGMNQQRVIEGIIAKATRPDIILNFGTILSNLGKIYDTNMTKNEITNLIKMQINDGAKWNIQTININGDGDVGNYSYMMPGYNLYVMFPYKECIDYATESINKVLKGINFKVNESYYMPENPTLVNYFGNSGINNYHETNVTPEYEEEPYQPPNIQYNNRPTTNTNRENRPQNNTGTNTNTDTRYNTHTNTNENNNYNNTNGENSEESNTGKYTNSSNHKNTNPNNGDNTGNDNNDSNDKNKNDKTKQP